MKQPWAIGFGIFGLLVGVFSLGYALYVVNNVQLVRASSAAGGADQAAVPVSAPSAPTYSDFLSEVAPAEGTTLDVVWGDMGQRLVEAGAIDLAKFEDLYGGLSDEQLEIVQGDSLREITFTRSNIQFWTNVLWAFGLAQESSVLAEGPMIQNVDRTPLGNYASTGGWTLGSQPATEIYNSSQLVVLTLEQDALVRRLAENIYRPCCGNSTAYPDCNHGMAVLGLLELMASQGANEHDMYQAALAFNSYAFSNTYVTLAAYFSAQEITWADVPAQEALGAEYSSAQGARQIASEVGEIAGTPGQGASCGA